MSKIEIDISGDRYHWLSPTGKRPFPDAIHIKHRDRYIARIKAERNPVLPATLDRMRDVSNRIHGIVILAKPVETLPVERPKPEISVPKQLAAWQAAITYLDNSEIDIRDVIERELAGATRPGRAISIILATRAQERVMTKVTELRTDAVRKAFLHVRDKLGDRLILDVSLARWAAMFLRDDLRNILQAIQTGLVEGLSNLDIARKVVGSISLNGIDGVTQYTRNKVAHLGRAAIRESNLRRQGLDYAGEAPDIPGLKPGE